MTGNEKTIPRYGGTTPKLVRECHVLHEFCKFMATHYRASYEPLNIHTATNQGLVVELNGATVDGVLRTSRGPVAVELLGYSPLNDRGDVMAPDLALRRFLTDALYDGLRSRQLSLTLGYGLRPRKDRTQGDARSVPLKRDFVTIADELSRVLELVPPLAFLEVLRVRFTVGRLARQLRQRSELYLDKSHFPGCAEHFDQVRFHGLTDDLEPQVGSNLVAGSIGLDRKWIDAQVAKKAIQSQGLSKQRANGRPLWLIIHSDGYATHQMIHRTHRPRAIEYCRDVLARSTHEFARVYWADQTAFLDAAWVGRVL